MSAVRSSSPLECSSKASLHYSPLARCSKQLRLLTVLPSERHEDEIDCLLVHADLEAEPLPPYETVSYVWGDLNFSCRLRVNGAVVPVSASSHAALRRMRLLHASRVVWLDALCINQQDEAERSQQVSMMGDIYRLAAGNLVYLGEDKIDDALDSVRAILDEAESEPGSFSRLRSKTGTWQYADTGIAARYDTAALVKLYSLPWFRRMWVLQEAALARQNTCFCGSTVVDLLQLTRAAAWLIYKYYFIEPALQLPCSYAADMNDLIDQTYGYHNTRTGHPAGVLYLLDLAQQRLSSVAADKIYGILGLTSIADTHSGLGITPDYSKSTAEVYRQATRSIIHNSGDLQILDYVRHWTRNSALDLQDFPSWVPKWHRSKDLDEHSNFMSLMFDACLGRKAVISTTDPLSTQPPDPGVLIVSGIHVGTITHTTGRIKFDEATRAAQLAHITIQAASQIQAAAAAPEPSNNPLGADALDLALAVTLCAGVDSSYQPAGEDTLSNYRSFRQLALTHARLPSLGECAGACDSPSTRASRFVEAMYNACMNRAFFTTADGRFGLGPHFLEEGDVVAVLYGLQWPAVLRRVGNEFVFLGTAYCYGFMLGEAVHQHDSVGGAVLDVFRIR